MARRRGMAGSSPESTEGTSDSADPALQGRRREGSRGEAEGSRTSANPSSPAAVASAAADTDVVYDDELLFGTYSRVAVMGMYIVFCAGMVIGLHSFHAWMGSDPLALALLNGPLISVDSWSLMHVVLFAGVGMVFPRQPLLMSIGYGLLWEGIEYALQTDGTFRQFWTEPPINSVWDLWFNLVGYTLGERLLVALVRQKRRRQQQKKT